MLHERLKQTRKLKGLTQEQLAELVHTKKSTISNYENRNSTPSNEMLVDLANVLNVTTDYLLGRSNIDMKFDSTLNLDQLKWLQFGDELKSNGFDLNEIECMLKSVIATVTIKDG